MLVSNVQENSWRTPPRDSADSALEHFGRSKFADLDESDVEGEYQSTRESLKWSSGQRQVIRARQDSFITDKCGYLIGRWAETSIVERLASSYCPKTGHAARSYREMNLDVSLATGPAASAAATTISYDRCSWRRAVCCVGEDGSIHAVKQGSFETLDGPGGRQFGCNIAPQPLVQECVNEKRGNHRRTSQLAVLEEPLLCRSPHNESPVHVAHFRQL